MSETPFETRCSILAQVWLDFRDDETFTDFFQYADLGLPLSYLLDNNIVKATPEAKNFVDETFELYLGLLGITEDTGFTDLDDLLETDFEDNEE